MLWVSVYLPKLSLQCHARGAVGELQAVPLVISDGTASRPIVHASNDCALQAGIEPRMPIAAARALASELLVISRELKKEQETLDLVANWLTQFSPMVCREPEGASLEISSMLRLFGGITALLSRLRHGMSELGFNVCVGIAPVPLAAWLLAKASLQSKDLRMCREPANLPGNLGNIPLTHFDWPSQTLEQLADLGLVRIKDLLALPRAGLRRRLGEQVLHDLDRVMGRAGDPREPHQLPDVFCSSMDFLFDIIEAERLLVPIRLLLNGMEGFMRARGVGTSEIVLEMKHGRASVTTHKFGSRNVSRNAGTWLQLIRERLTAHLISEAVVGLRLHAGQLISHQGQNESWLPSSESGREKWHALIERIVSRLGEGSVFAVREHGDHRPELAWREDAAPFGERAKKNEQQNDRKPRPLLLLREPLALVTMEDAPQHHGPLALLAGPERIDTGWWDGQPVARDYYVAVNPQREVCWVYRDYRAGKRWYLHGYFS